MSDSGPVKPRPRGARPPAWQTTGAVIATAALALLAAACSSSPSLTGGSPAAGGSADPTSAVAYSHCVCGHGVPNYPDPGSGGTLPKVSAQQLGVSSPQLQAARRACQHLLPATGGSLDANSLRQCELTGDCPQALVQQMMNADLKLARCMRSHGLPNFPDPTNGGSSGPVFNITRVGISDAASHARLFIAKLNECGRLVGRNAPESFE